MIIGIDIDNVLNTLVDAVLSVYNEDSGDNLAATDIKKYYMEYFVKENYRENFYKYFIDRRTWKRIKLVKDCQKYVAKLFNDGHKILFITSTEPANLKKKANWLERNFPYLNIRKSLFSCPIKQYMAGIDVLVDDCAANLVNAQYRGVLLSYAWNSDVTFSDSDNKNIVRVNNWEEIYNAINNME